MSSLGNKANDNNGKISKLESIKKRFSKTAKEEVSDEIASEDKAASILLIVVNALFGLYLILHQTVSTGFFTPKFSGFEMIMLYGIPIYWITTSVLILIGQKHPSRDLLWRPLFCDFCYWLAHCSFPLRLRSFCKRIAGFPQVSSAVDFQ